MRTCSPGEVGRREQRGAHGDELYDYTSKVLLIQPNGQAMVAMPLHRDCVCSPRADLWCVLQRYSINNTDDTGESGMGASFVSFEGNAMPRGCC